MRAEHAAVDVRLVDDDVAKVREHVAPAVVVRQDADVEHVRVREDEVRPAADLPAPLARRVAVVDRGARARELERRERACLILRERLRRVEVERPQLRVARDRVEHGQVERERLSRRGAGRDDDVLAAPRRVPRVTLVEVQRVERKRVADAWVQVVRQRRKLRLARGLGREVRELLALDEIVPACDACGHASRIPAGVSLALVVTVLALAGCGSHKTVEVPNNHGHLLDDALRRLHDAGLRATFPAASSPCGDGLPWVNLQSPRAPASVERGSAVSLKFEVSPIPSPVYPLHHARWAHVPRLVGDDYSTAKRKITAIWPCVHVRAANATAASRLMVVAQRPAAGTRVPAYGVKTGQRGYRPTTIDAVAAG